MFRELFDAYFRNPKIAHKLLSQLLPSAEGKAEPSKRRPRVREALSPQHAFGQAGQAQAGRPEGRLRRRHDGQRPGALETRRFQLPCRASEYRLVERLARDVRLPLPHFASRRTRPASAGNRIHWPGVMHQAAQTGGEMLRLPRLQRRAAAAAPVGAGRCVGLDGALRPSVAGLFACRHAPPPHDVTCLPLAPI